MNVNPARPVSPSALLLRDCLLLPTAIAVTVDFTLAASDLPLEFTPGCKKVTLRDSLMAGVIAFHSAL